MPLNREWAFGLQNAAVRPQAQSQNATKAPDTGIGPPPKLAMVRLDEVVLYRGRLRPSRCGCSMLRSLIFRKTVLGWMPSSLAAAFRFPP